jgi:hypothetical protein
MFAPAVVLRQLPPVVSREVEGTPDPGQLRMRFCASASLAMTDSSSEGFTGFVR